MFEKFTRQISLEDFGELGQARLAKSTICIVGAGGVASGAIPLLAACGLKKLKICDFDKVSISNLHRQTIFKEKELGLPKVLCAKNFCEELNSETQIEIFDEKIENNFACKNFFADADLTIDASDNFATRFAISKICESLKKPVIMAAAQGYETQITVFNSGFYFEDFVPDKSAQKETSKAFPIFPASASLSGVIAASLAIQSLAKLEVLQGGKFIHINLQSLKFYDGILPSGKM